MRDLVRALYLLAVGIYTAILISALLIGGFYLLDIINKLFDGGPECDALHLCLPLF